MEEIVSSKAIQENSIAFEFHINSYERKELYGSAFEFIKRSVIFILLIWITLICMFFILPLSLYFLLSFSMPAHLILISPARLIPIFCHFVIELTFIWTFCLFMGAYYLRKFTRNLSIKINSEYMILSSDKRYDEIDIKSIKIKEKKNGTILIFKRTNNQRKSKKINLMKKIISWYDCIPLLESNFTKEEIEIIKHLINQKNTKA